jgi:hypothetical protein
MQMSRLTNPAKSTFAKLTITLVVTMVGLACCDLLFGLCVHLFLPEAPQILYVKRGVPGILDFWNMTDSGIQPITVTGSSMMEQAFSARAFEHDFKALTQQQINAANVSVPGATIAFSYEMIRDVIVPGGAPTVIYGVEMLAFRPIEDPLNNSQMGQVLGKETGLTQAIHLWLLHHSTLVQYRENILQLLTGMRQIDTEKFNAEDDKGWVPVHNVFNGKITDSMSTIIRLLSSIGDYDLSLRTLDNLADFCKHQKITCIVVNMPLHPMMNQRIRGSDTIRYKTALQRLVDSGIEVWDVNTTECLNSMLNGFVDLNHLNVIGAQKFTQIMAELYAYRVMGISLTSSATASCARLNKDVFPAEF